MAVLAACLVLGAGTCAAESASPIGPDAKTPLSLFRQADGRLAVPPGFSGGLDLTGWRMETGPGGEPRFQPRDAAGTSGDDVYWDDQFPMPGVDGTIYEAAADASGAVYVVGDFTRAGNVLTRGVAKWDGVSWSALGSGIDGVCHSVAVRGIDVFVGGAFTTAGSVPANNVARWNGSAWSALGAGSSVPVHNLEAGAGKIYATGFFATTGPVATCNVAVWDGVQWSALGTGIGGSVYDLATNGSTVYACGLFSTAGGVTARNAAMWNGTAWSALGEGVAATQGNPCCVTVCNNNVYIGFDNFAWTYSVHVAKWDGSSWSDINYSASGGQEQSCRELVTSGTDVIASYKSLFYIGEDEYNSYLFGGTAGVIRLNGSAWESLGTWGGAPSSGFNIDALAPTRNGLLAGGETPFFAQTWDGTSWSVPGNGISRKTFGVRALAAIGGDIYVGGAFTRVGDLPVNAIAKWDGTAWSALGEGIVHEYGAVVHSLAVNGNALYAGGYFTTAGLTAASNVARWDGAGWSALGPGVSGGRVWSLETDGSTLYAGGVFTTAGLVAARNVAAWNGTQWSALGSGIEGPGASAGVYALKMCGGDLYAGGSFTTAGLVAASCIARWNGSAWSGVGGGVDGSVSALATSGSYLYVGGLFNTAGSVPARNIAMWNGTAWSALGAGIDGYVSDIAASGGCVYVGCGSMNPITASCIAKWDGAAWSGLGSGIVGDAGYSSVRWPEVEAVVVAGNALFAGGDFALAGGKVSGHFAAWQPRVDVWPAVVTASPGAMTIGHAPYGFYKPALVIDAGASVTYAGGLPTTVTLDQAAHIEVNGRRVNGAFTLSPEGMQFGGGGAQLRIEFSEDDAALAGRPWTDFRAAQLTYPADYPANREAAGVTPLADSVPVPVRIENGRRIYAITVPFTGIASTYGAVPWPTTAADDWQQYR